jgi:hypothetical protein
MSEEFGVPVMRLEQFGARYGLHACSPSSSRLVEAAHWTSVVDRLGPAAFDADGMQLTRAAYEELVPQIPDAIKASTH